MQTDRRDVKQKHLFMCFLFGPGGVRRGGPEGGVQSGSEGFRSRGGSNICWFRREAVGSPKKFLAPVGSEIFQPKVYSWEPSWYFGGGFKRKHFVAGAMPLVATFFARGD